MASSESQIQQAEAWSQVYDTCLSLGFRPTDDPWRGMHGADAVCAFIRSLSVPHRVDPGLRDWFAGAALEGMLSSGDHRETTNSHLAEYSYAVADRMLAARETTPAADSEPAA